MHHTQIHTGNYIIIENEELKLVYAHCKELKVKEGDFVKQGDVISTVGSTGNSTGPHLHFEIRINDEKINPRLLLDFSN